MSFSLFNISLLTIYINVFGTLSIIYKEEIYIKYFYTTFYLINKIDFLEICYIARDKAIILSNI
jgi:intracellular septation protein A